MLLIHYVCATQRLRCTDPDEVRTGSWSRHTPLNPRTLSLRIRCRCQCAWSTTLHPAPHTPHSANPQRRRTNRNLPTSPLRTRCSFVGCMFGARFKVQGRGWEKQLCRAAWSYTTASFFTPRTSGPILGQTQKRSSYRGTSRIRKRPPHRTTVGLIVNPKLYPSGHGAGVGVPSLRPFLRIRATQSPSSILAVYLTPLVVN